MCVYVLISKIYINEYLLQQHEHPIVLNYNKRVCILAVKGNNRKKGYQINYP